jgi:hydrogenase nickel incorporation protein HypB
MCTECGCGLPGEKPATISVHHHHHDHDHDQDRPHDHPHAPEHEPEHGHSHDHEHAHPGGVVHSHPHTHDPGRRTVEVRQAILEKNDRQAERNRGFFRARGILALNVLSSPGSGKTTFIRETVRQLRGRLKAGIIVGDLATDNDAQRLRESGAPVVQINTGTVCHLEAEMVSRAIRQFDSMALDLLIVENVGNLVCPASYDLGEDLRVVLLSVTEGEDKPLKYPPMFQSAKVVVVSKTDLAEACGHSREQALGNIRRMAPAARIFETSAKTGDGMGAWCDFVLAELKAARNRSEL